MKGGCVTFLNVLYVKFEDMKEDIKYQVKRLARHLGCSFSNEEESEGVVENIIKLCGFKNLKNLEVNQSGKTWIIDNKHFFRKGEVGDWMNHLTPQMAEQVDQITEQKLHSHGLIF
ncbi:hypothetical protein Sjap_003137 [Stephania japonica]|uniref:Sulfotransferase n=1 Tax=Stephania japonica TaxID=461633 RepID=A0AAP0KQB1_9MAGN